MGMEINAAAVPLFPEAKEYYDMGMVAGGLTRNRDYRKNMVDFSPAVPQYLQDILFDPQTSGGLLIAVPKAKAPRLLKKLHARGVTEARLLARWWVNTRAGLGLFNLLFVISSVQTVSQLYRGWRLCLNFLALFLVVYYPREV